MFLTLKIKIDAASAREQEEAWGFTFTVYGAG